ncbi:hypothetical protein L4C34_05395 [Vibrio profundum]|uniref:hypothetical protein n=1 Tax=Vibrio profundum TaxID=2910247 RepID=UPI003D14DD38
MLRNILLIISLSTISAIANAATSVHLLCVVPGGSHGHPVYTQCNAGDIDGKDFVYIRVLKVCDGDNKVAHLDPFPINNTGMVTMKIGKCGIGQNFQENIVYAKFRGQDNEVRLGSESKHEGDITLVWSQVGTWKVSGLDHL